MNHKHIRSTIIAKLLNSEVFSQFIGTIKNNFFRILKASLLTCFFQRNMKTKKLQYNLCFKYFLLFL